MRPNYAQDPPPTSIEVGGHAYPCNTDYRVWLEVLRQMEELRLDDWSEAGRARLKGQLIDLETAVFGGVLADEDPFAALGAISAFSRGYPTAPSRAHTREQTYSFDYDLNEIIIAIRNQSGIDLSYRRTEPFHWWEFLLEFRTLCGDHYILNLMDIRGYSGKDPELRRRKQEHALPDRYTQAEMEEYAAFNAMFDADDADSNGGEGDDKDKEANHDSH